MSQLEALAAFARRFLDPEDLGYAVGAYTRDQARVALGRPPVESALSRRHVQPLETFMPQTIRPESVIKPSIGRKVWYRPSKSDITGPMPMSICGSIEAGTAQPLDATVIAVWGDRCVNVLVTDIVGKQFPVLSATLVQAGDEAPAAGRYVEWMPYQQGQAKKHAPEGTPPAA